MTHNDLSVLAHPEGRHLAIRYDGVTDWVVSVLRTADEDDTCEGVTQRVETAHEVEPGVTLMCYPADGQGDPACLSCCVSDGIEVVSVTAQQAADMLLWPIGTTQPTITYIVEVA